MAAIFQAMVGKVCVIGAGPSGLGILCWFAKQKRDGKVVIIITIIIIIISINIVATVTITPEEKRRGVESLSDKNICGTCNGGWRTKEKVLLF